MTDVRLRSGQRLRYTLARGQSRLAQIGCAFALAAASAWWAPVFLRAEGDAWLRFTFAAGAALIALLFVYGASLLVFAMKTPLTIVEADRHPLPRGESTQLLIRQRGPAELEWLRVTLIGETTWVEGVGRWRNRQRRELGPYEVLDCGPVAIEPDVPFEKMTALEVPMDIPPTETGDRMTTWAIRVAASVRGRADFEHSFPVRIV